MRKLMLPLAAVCAFGVSAAPAMAASANVKQNKKIGKINGAVKGVQKAISILEDINSGQTDSVNKAHAKADALKTTVDTIVSVAGTALPALESGLKAAAAGLTTLAGAYQSVEYGIGGIKATGATPTVAAGGSAMSADVPDDGNTAHVGDTAIVVAGASAAMAIDLVADIRSNEGDKGAGSTVGQAGGFLWVQNLDTGARVACIGAPNPPGILGTTAGDSIVTPTGTVTNLPVKNLPGGRERTDTTAPSTSILPVACNFVAAAGTTYGVTYSINFLDVPTSTSPGGTE